MLYIPPKTVITTMMTSLRAWPDEPLASCVFRRGPQRALKTTIAQKCACIIELAGMPDGEQSKGSGNNWWHNWAIKVLLMVKDDEADPEGAEDMRLDLLEEFLQWLQSNRSLLDNAKVGKVTGLDLGLLAFAENERQVWRYADVTLDYRTLRSGAP